MNVPSIGTEVFSEASIGTTRYKYAIGVTINSQNIANNTSNVTIKFYGWASSSPSTGAYYLYSSKNSIDVNGENYLSIAQTNIDFRTTEKKVIGGYKNGSSWSEPSDKICTITRDFTHNANGSLNLSITASFYFPYSSSISSIPTGKTYTYSDTFTLKTIPRGSTFTCEDSVELGNKLNFKITNFFTSGYSVDLKYTYGGSTVTVYSSEANPSSTITVPPYDTDTRFRTSNKEISVPFTLTTHYGSQTFTFSKNVKILVSSPPSISLTGQTTDTNTYNLTQARNKAIKGISTVLFTLTATPYKPYSSTPIKELKIDSAVLQDTSSMTSSKTSVQSLSCACYAKDERSNSVTQTKTASGITLIDYFSPENRSTASRLNPTSDTINVHITGRAKYYTDFYESGTKKNNYISYRILVNGVEKQGWTTTTVSSSNSFSTTATIQNSGIHYTDSGTVTIEVKDMVKSAPTVTLTVGRGIPMFDFGKEDISENGNLSFRFNVPVDYSMQIRKSIPQNSDLNDILTYGYYRCSMSSTAATLSNCPTTYAFILDVIPSTGRADLEGGVQPSTYTGYMYFVQILTTYVGKIYIRYLNYSGSSTLHVGTWNEVITGADSSVSTSSTNPVQNSAITTYVNNKTANIPTAPNMKAVKSSATFSSGIATVSISDIKTSSIIMAQRVARTSSESSANYWGIMAAVCTSNGTVKLCTNGTQNETVDVFIWYTT